MPTALADEVPPSRRERLSTEHFHMRSQHSAVRRLGWAASLAATAMICAAPAFGQGASTGPPTDQEVLNLADELIELRGDVEELHTQLATLKEQHRSRMSALARERGELEGEVNREQLALDQLRASIAKNEAAAQAAGMGDDALKPAVLNAIGLARRHVDGSLPFKVRERHAALDELERQTRSAVLPAPKVVNRLWAFYEDELRLTRENGIYRQPIDVEGSSKLVDVARIGMVMMFFRTADGEYGQVRRSGAGWSFGLVDDGAGRDQVARLFDSLEKQVRTGYFELPGALDVTGGRS